MAQGALDTSSFRLVSVGIVNWNGGAWLGECLKSLFAQSHPDLEVILVDNASTDGSAEQIEAQFPKVRVVRNRQNAGFARAQNQAIRLARGRYYMPLNPDVALERGFVAALVGALESRPEFGYATGLVYFSRERAEAEDLVYTSGHLFVRNCYAYNRFTWMRRGRERFEAGEVGGASGVCPLYRREMLEDIAVEGEYFDEDFFMYEEDVDLDWRAHLRGWRCWFEPRAVARHVVEGTGGSKRAWIRGQILANRWLMIAKDADGELLRRCWPYILKFDLTHQLGALLRQPAAFPYAVGHFLRKIGSARRKRRVVQAKRKASAQEIWEWMERNREELVRTTREGRESAP